MKTRADLADSRQKRRAVIAEFGRIPESILRHDRRIKAIDLIVENRSYASKANDGGHTGKLARIFDVSGQSCRGEEGALSRFPQNVGRSLLLLYSRIDDIVLDPFAGHNSRMELCWRSNRNYIGCDISKNFMVANLRARNLLREQAEMDLFGRESFTASINLFLCDSRFLPFRDEIADFTITSPPYWNIEDYGDEPQQLGLQDYSGFLTGLQMVADENFRCLKDGAFCVWCVNDFRSQGKFYSYHEDACSILRRAGFYQHDIAITDLGPAIRAAFAQQIIETQILPKRHEYCLIFRKAKNKGNANAV